MNCAECRELLVPLVRGILPADRAEKVRHHLESCGACAAEAEEWKHLCALVASLPPGALAADRSTGSTPHLSEPELERMAAYAGGSLRPAERRRWAHALDCAQCLTDLMALREFHRPAADSPRVPLDLEAILAAAEARTGAGQHDPVKPGILVRLRSLAGQALEPLQCSGTTLRPSYSTGFLGGRGRGEGAGSSGPAAALSLGPLLQGPGEVELRLTALSSGGVDVRVGFFRAGSRRPLTGCSVRVRTAGSPESTFDVADTGHVRLALAPGSHELACRLPGTSEELQVRLELE